MQRGGIKEKSESSRVLIVDGGEGERKRETESIVGNKPIERDDNALSSFQTMLHSTNSY